ncbi:glycosyl hydrolase, partial [mine drainage metagenome]
NAIWIDPKNAQHLIVGAAGGGLWQSNNGGSSWTAIAEFPGSLAVGAIAQLPNGTILVGTGDSVGYSQQIGTGILASTDNGQTWTPITGTAPRSDADFWSYVNSIAVSANGIALASTSSGIARSADGGQTWAQVYPVGSATVTSYDVVFDPNSPKMRLPTSTKGP